MAGPGATQQEQEQQQQLQQRLYQEINALRGQARELQLKHDNQSVLLKHTEEELRELKIKYRKLRAGQQGDGGAALGHARPEAALESVRKQLEAKEQELQKTHALLDKTLYENGTLEANIEDIRDREAQNLAEIERLNMRLESLQDALNSVKAVAYQLEEENQALTEELRDLRVVEAELRESIANKDDILGSLQSEAQMIGKQKSDMNAARRERNRNTRQVLLLAENSNRMQGEMHASLLAHQRLLEELKTEYEEHAELVRAEWNLDRKAKIEDYDRLSEQLENLKIIQLEDKEQLLREQGEVVRALQTQFEEYRQTAEYLFTTEATKLEDKVRVQAAKYEEEIKYMVKAKDQHFDTMMSAKDAKILNLVEGTDLQSILIKHEQEIEQLRRSHADDLAAMRQRTEAEQRDTISALRKQIDASAVVHAKLEDRLAKADERVREALDLNRKRLEQQAQREEKHMEDLQAIQNLLEEAHRAKEKLNQDKQDLRHRIVRLKIKVKGDGDETLPNLVKRLSLETSSLKAKYNKMLGYHELVVKKHRQLEQKTLVQKQQIDRVREGKEAKERELTELAHNFSRVLFSRVRAAMGVDAAPTTLSKYASRNADRGASNDQEGRDLTLRRALATLQEVLDGDSSIPSAEKHTLEEDQAQGVDKANTALSNEVNDSPESARGGGAKIRFQVPSALRKMRAKDADLVDRAEVLELARGMKYLAKFRKLSSAYTGGTFRLPASETAASAARTQAYDQGNMLHLRTEIIGRHNDLFAGKEIYSKFDAALASRATPSPRPAEPGVRVYMSGSDPSGNSSTGARIEHDSSGATVKPEGKMKFAAEAPEGRAGASAVSSPRHRRLVQSDASAGEISNFIVSPHRPGGAES